MLSSIAELTPEERAIGHKYWRMMLFPHTPRELQSACYDLNDEAQHVIDAVTDALAEVWNSELEPQPEDNPFVEAQ